MIESDPTVVSESIQNDGSEEFEQTFYSDGEQIWVPLPISGSE